MIRALFLLLAWTMGAAHAEAFTARVIVVMDGDTVMVLRGAQKIKIRLANIDAPEKDQAFGIESRQALVDKVYKKEVVVTTRAIDKYGRTVADLSMDGQSINEEMVGSGMAWEYSWRHRNQAYRALQSEAQRAKRGLWADASPTPPWVWRKTHPSKPCAHPCRN
jgi:endonuclease YncB( thermonuclease family)